MKWKDVTSYRRDEREQHLPPRAWELPGICRVLIHRMHGLDGVWFLTAYDVRIDSKQLSATTEDGAKGEAIAIVERRLADLTRAFRQATQSEGVAP